MTHMDFDSGLNETHKISYRASAGQNYFRTKNN